MSAQEFLKEQLDAVLSMRTGRDRGAVLLGLGIGELAAHGVTLRELSDSIEMIYRQATGELPS